MKYFSIILLLSFSSNFSTSWGFFAHKLINKHAVYSLPQSMNTFYINNIDLLEEKAVDADKRRYSDKDEAHKHTTLILTIIVLIPLLLLCLVIKKMLLLNSH